MNDPSLSRRYRRRLREKLQREYGEVFNGGELRERYKILGFTTNRVAVRRLSDGETGTMQFSNRPKYYFDFHAAEFIGDELWAKQTPQP